MLEEWMGEENPSLERVSSTPRSSLRGLAIIRQRHLSYEASWIPCLVWMGQVCVCVCIGEVV